MADEDHDYETDPDDSKPYTSMRRRQVSDDDEEHEEGNRMVDIVSDEESEGQGGVEEYYDDEEDDNEYDYVENCDEFKDIVDRDVEKCSVDKAKEFRGHVIELNENVLVESDVTGKKENEPFAVPTAGAFYMHDNRFKENSGVRHRKTSGGKKLWETADNKKWGHDKFEEITTPKRGYEEGRKISKSHFQTCSRNRGAARGYARGDGTGMQTNNLMPAPKNVRGRGPRRYEPLWKKCEFHPSQHPQSRKSPDRSSQINSQSVSDSTSNRESNPAIDRIQVIASSLSSASPPFYPSVSSSKDATAPQKKAIQAKVSDNNSRIQVVDEFSRQHSSALQRGKNIIGSMDKMCIDDSNPPIVGKPLTKVQLPPSRSSLNNMTQFSQPRAHGRGSYHPVQTNFQPNPNYNQVNRASSTQVQASQKSPMQHHYESSLQIPSHVFPQHSIGGSGSSSPPRKSLSINSFESAVEYPESNNSMMSLVGKGRNDTQESGKGIFLYNGAQTIGSYGNMDIDHGDQNFPPAFLQVMQFSGQRTGGMGVPAVGMAFPGYVAQPGRGKSEMTWLPVLAGSSALCGAYCPPYLTVDGAYDAHLSRKTHSALSSSNETSTSKPNNHLNNSQRPEHVNDEFGQRQNKARRYSEMSFGQ